MRTVAVADGRKPASVLSRRSRRDNTGRGVGGPHRQVGVASSVATRDSRGGLACSFAGSGGRTRGGWKKRRRTLEKCSHVYLIYGCAFLGLRNGLATPARCSWPEPERTPRSAKVLEVLSCLSR